MEDQGTSAYAKLLEKIMPIDRGDRYEIPLEEALLERGLGQVTGGGTMQEKSGEIEYAGIDITLRDLVEGIPFVCRFLEERGSPKGSTLQICDRDAWTTKASFGSTEGIGVYLDGTNLPEDVYRTCDINVVWKEFSSRLGDEGEVRGHWHGPSESALNIYGRSASRMQSLLADFISTYPLCRGARIVAITPVDAQ